jgi:hypothetical protein
MQLHAGETLKPFYPELQVESDCASGLVVALIAMDGYSAGFHDYGPNRLHATWQGAYKPELVPGAYGPAWPFDNDVTHIAKSSGSFAVPATGFTMAIVCQAPLAAGTFRGAASNSFGSSPPGFGITWTGSGSLRVDVGNTNVSAVFPTALNGTWCRILYTFDGITTTSWLNGQVFASGAFSGSFTPPASDYVQIGVKSGNSFNTPIDSVFVWNRPFRDSESRDWSTDPWWAFRPERARIPFSPPLLVYLTSLDHVTLASASALVARVCGLDSEALGEAVALVALLDARDEPSLFEAVSLVGHRTGIDEVTLLAAMARSSDRIFPTHIIPIITRLQGLPDPRWARTSPL